jgi:uncharacterized membrane protein
MTNSGLDLTRDYSVNIGLYFSRGWDIFKEYAGGFIGFLLITVVISVASSLLPYPLGTNEDGLGGIVNLVLSPILTAGYYIVAFSIAKGRSPSFGDFFKGFNSFLQIFLVYLVTAILTAVGFVLVIIPGIYLAVSYMFAMPLVVEKHMSFWEAMEGSRQLITKNWLAFFGLAILLVLINIAGLIPCGLGLLITAPWTMCIIVAAYEDIIGLNGSAVRDSTF